MRFRFAKYLSRFVTRRQGMRPPSRWDDIHQKPALEPLEDRLLLSIVFSNSGSRNVAYSGGNIISNPDVVLIFWGSGWTRGSGPALRANLTPAIGNIMNSPYLSGGGRGDGLIQYHVGDGHLPNALAITSSDPPNQFTDAQVDQMLQANISNHVLPDFHNDNQILYLVVPQPGSVNVDPSVGGEHDSDRLGFNGPRFHYGWTINGGSNGESVDFLTNVLSHELVEAATDPESNFPNGTAYWVPSTNDEICDGEAQSYSYRVNGALVQSFLSQNRHAYIVPTGQNQDFFVSSSRTLTVLGDQLANRDDTITVSTQGGGVRVTLNGETAQFEPGAISSIVINPGTGNDRVTIGATPAGVPVTVNLGSGYNTVTIGAPTLNNAASVTVNGQPGGQAQLIVDDHGTPTSETYTVTNSSVTRTSGGVGAITYRNIQILDVNVGTATEAVQVLSTNTATRTIIYGGSGIDTVTIGTPGLLNHGPLVIDGANSRCTLNINDQSTVIAQTYTITSAAVTAEANTISYSHIANLVLNVGSGGETTNVQSTAAGTTTTIDGGSRIDLVNLGLNNSLALINGPVVLANNGSQARLNVNDASDTASHPSVFISSGGITGLAPAAISFTSSSVNHLVVNGSPGSTTYMVAATPAATDMALTTGRGNNETVNVQAATVALTLNFPGNNGNNVLNLGLNHSLGSISGAVTITGAGLVAVFGDDSADSSNRAVVLGPGGLTGIAPAPINFNYGVVSTLVINGGRGNNTYTIAATPPSSSVTLNTGPGIDTIFVRRTSDLVHIDSSAGSGADHIYLGETTNTLDFLTGEVRVNAAATDTLVLNDQGTPRARTYRVLPNYVVWAGHDVSFSGLQSVTINGSADSTFDLSTGTSTAAAVILNGLGSSSLIGSNAGNFWEITGADTGVLSGSAYPNPVAFNQVGSLTAGTGGDYFLLDDGATLSGNLAGGGSDTLDYGPYSTTVIVDLQTGAATGVAGSVSGIRNVVGGSGGPADSSVYNLLIGNGGNTLTGGTGRRNILVAGGSASTLIGGDQDDLLIGGTTMYDSEVGLASWQQIAAYWAGTDDYFTRVANLTSGNGVPLLDASTVSNNGGGNTLLGHDGGAGELNLYYGLDPSQENTDYDPSTGEQFINV